MWQAEIFKYSLTHSTDIITLQVAVTDTAQQVLAENTDGGRLCVTFTNVGPSNVFIGSSNSVTANTGHGIPVGQSLKVDRNYGAVYAICANSANSTLTVLQEGQ